MRKLALITSVSALLLVPALANAQTYDEEEEVKIKEKDGTEEVEVKEKEEIYDDDEMYYGGSMYGGSMYGGATYGTEVQVMPREEPAELEAEAEEEPFDFIGGVSLSVGGGVTDFVKDDARDITDVGGLWEARLGIGHDYLIGAEVAYVGTAASMDVLGLDNDAVLLSNGIEGVARVNIGNWGVQPFLFGGVGWANYDIVNDDFNTSSISGDDNMVTIPVGGGVAGHLSGFLVDARFTYRPTFADDLFDLSSLGDPDTATMDTWQVTARVGYEF